MDLLILLGVSLAGGVGAACALRALLEIQSTAFVVIAAIIAGITIFSLLVQKCCTKCFAFLSMKEIERTFEGEDTISREVTVPEIKTYIVDGKIHRVQQRRKERQYADVNVYRCCMQCEKCGDIKYVTKYEPR